jgi:thiol:disulfide interchange protein DsbD
VKARVLGRAFAAVFLIAGFVMMKPSPAAKFWQDWSKEKQEALLKEGKSVYVDFTAAWCVTCQTNKAAAYTDETIQLFKAHGIVPLKADKTSDVPAIDAELKRLGKVGIPVNVLYVRGNPEPQVTQTILTAGYLQDFIRQHLGEPPSK